MIFLPAATSSAAFWVLQEVPLQHRLHESVIMIQYVWNPSLLHSLLPKTHMQELK